MLVTGVLFFCQESLPWAPVLQFVQQLSLRLTQQRQQQLLETACNSAQWVDKAAFAKLYELLLQESEEVCACGASVH